MSKTAEQAALSAPARATDSTPYGVPIPVRSGLYLVHVPLPHSPLRSLNSYIILDDDTTTIVDVGFNHPACEKALDDALSALGRTWDSVQVVLTHSHPDHTGNLDRIYHDGMRVYANLHSFQEVENLQEMEERVFRPLLRQAATPEQLGAMVAEDGLAVPHVSAELLPLQSKPSLIYLADGDTFAVGEYTFEIVETPGHNPWHICLYERSQKLMIIGDHVLERITPAVSSWFPAYNALEEFLHSLQKIRGYEVDLILPAHGTPYANLAGRVDSLVAHHRERLQEIYGLVASGHSDIVDISSHAKWRYRNWDEWPLDQKFFSMGETMAHLIYLVCEGRIRQTICGNEYRFELP